MNAQPEVTITLPPFPLDYTGNNRSLMESFVSSDSLTSAVKENIKFDVWARLDERSRAEYGKDRGIISKLFSKFNAYSPIVGLLVAFLLAILLPFYWSHWQYSSNTPFGSLIAAVITSFLLILIAGIGDWLINDNFAAALTFAVAAIIVLAFRGLPQIAFLFPDWLFFGLRAGLFASITTAGLFIFFHLLSLIEKFIDFRWSLHPQAQVVANLIWLLSDLEILNSIEKRRRQEVLQAIAQAKDISDEDAEAAAKPGSTRAYMLQNEALGRKYELQTKAIRETDREWLTFRRLTRLRIKDIANYVEHGLPNKLRLGRDDADEWLQSEFKGKAFAIRAWERQIAIPSSENLAKLLGEVATAINHTAKGDWYALPQVELADEPGTLQRLWRFVRIGLIGALPLSLVIIAPRLGFEIPDALNGALLTFAIPWLGYQLLALADPDASDHLSGTKELLGFMPKG